MPHPVGGAMGVTLALYHCRAARETRFDIILFIRQLRAGSRLAVVL